MAPLLNIAISPNLTSLTTGMFRALVNKSSTPPQPKVFALKHDGCDDLELGKRKGLLITSPLSASDLRACIVPYGGHFF